MFGITIRLETPSIRKGTSGLVDKNEGVPKATHQDAVTKGNIDNLKEEGLFAVNGAAARSFWDRCKCTQR
jgi:hypothetical protein